MKLESLPTDDSIYVKLESLHTDDSIYVKFLKWQNYRNGE